MASMRKGWRNWSCLRWRRQESRDMMTTFKYVRSSYGDNGDQRFPYALGVAQGQFGLICSKFFSKYLFVMVMKHWKGYLGCRIFFIGNFYEVTQVCRFQARDSLYFLMLDTCCHRPCIVRAAGITSGLITAFPIQRGEGQELLKFQEGILHYMDPTAPVSSLERQKAAKTRLGNIWSRKSTSQNYYTRKRKGSCSQGYFTNSNISQVLERKITREKQSICVEGPKLLGSLANMWITSIIWSIISWYVDCKYYLKDCNPPQRKGNVTYLHLSVVPCSGWSLAFITKASFNSTYKHQWLHIHKHHKIM